MVRFLEMGIIDEYVEHINKLGWKEENLAKTFSLIEFKGWIKKRVSGIKILDIR